MRRALLLVPLAVVLAPPSAFAQVAPKRPPAKPNPPAAAGPPPAAPLPPPPQPPPPPPWTSPGPATTSTSGDSLMPEGAAGVTPVVAPPPPAPAAPTVDATTTDNRFKMIEARLAADEVAAADSAPQLAWLKGLRVSGYLQPQLLIQGWNTAASPNVGSTGALPAGIGANDVVARANGTTTNGTFFRLRRARFKTEYMPTDAVRFVFEIDPTPAGGTSGGIGTIARNVEAQGVVHWREGLVTDFGMGIFKIPFGNEVLQSDADRPFIERSWGEGNLTPGEFDTGAKAYTTYKNGKYRLDVQLAIVNGQTLGEKTFTLLPDLNKGKDFVGRAAFDWGWGTLGASGYYGQGQTVDPTALRFKQFVRQAVNVEGALRFSVPKKNKEEWQTRILAELTLAQDMDRGVNYAFAVPSIPGSIASDVNDQGERNLWVRLEQDMSRWFTLGLRFDQYTPNVSQGDDARNTFGGVAVLHFGRHLQAMLEYDHAIDHVHAPGAAIPDRQIDSGSGVLQARF